MNTGRNSKQTTCLCRDTGGKGTLPAQRTSFNTLDNCGHKTSTQSKRKRTGKKVQELCESGGGRPGLSVLTSLLVSVDVKHHVYFTLPAASLFPQCPCRGRLFVYCCGRCSCVNLRGEPVSSYFSMACYSIVSISVNNVCL